VEVYALASFHGSTGFYSTRRVYIYSFSVNFFMSPSFFLYAVHEILGLDSILSWKKYYRSCSPTYIQTIMDLTN